MLQSLRGMKNKTSDKWVPGHWQNMRSWVSTRSHVSSEGYLGSVERDRRTTRELACGEKRCNCVFPLGRKPIKVEVAERREEHFRAGTLLRNISQCTRNVWHRSVGNVELLHAAERVEKPHPLQRVRHVVRA